MYRLQDQPAKQVLLENGGIVSPLATLKDEYGGVSHIVEDDKCLVLLNKNSDGQCVMVTHWYPEAVAALQNLKQWILVNTRQS